MASPSEEKYLEEIYYAVLKNGYTSVTEMAISLNVSVSSVTKMVQKLSKEGYLYYKRYEKIRMTEKGLLKGETLAYNHQILEEFFHLIELDKDQIPQEVANIEYHISGNAVSKIRDFISKEKYEVN
ncbi:transcriptional regulator MntR [Bacillus sp. V3-13]|uniref:iron dependent repressor, metal binding and dimerization domain protein n=1 Tax=Bacillus sp. V3-13 TaxID=2053728 RepID=UPI000C788B20|nr:iron dependent repressor, metal binding and dimerization domain protein [Bacillus sp. V3-13]PLR78504.1 transcriptional regulator MntR [Bacillus sp. V3-13]